MHHLVDTGYSANVGERLRRVRKYMAMTSVFWPTTQTSSPMPRS